MAKAQIILGGESANRYNELIYTGRYTHTNGTGYKEITANFIRSGYTSNADDYIRFTKAMNIRIYVIQTASNNQLSAFSIYKNSSKLVDSETFSTTKVIDDTVSSGDYLRLYREDGNSTSEQVTFAVLCSE